MIVYFTASIVGKKQSLSHYQKIIDVVKSKGLEIVSDHIMNATEQQIRLETRGQRVFSKKGWKNGFPHFLGFTAQ